MGFLPGRSTEDALFILEDVIQKSIDKHMPLWFASLDLKKAFDRIEWVHLLDALTQQGVPTEYSSLITALYENQTGVLSETEVFGISRGVRQGDVLSPLLFNAALEHCLRRWKSRLGTHGLKMSNVDGKDRLSNVRFADDLTIYANSLPELVEMLDMLVEELRRVGLDLNAKKSKILTLDEATFNAQSPVLVEVADGFIEVLRAGESHKYLGAALPGDLRRRGGTILAHRLQCAWSKFHMFKHALTNRHVDKKLRLRLFDSVVTPCALYGLSTTALTANEVERLAATERKMIRRIVGYTELRDGDWADMHRRLNAKIEKAMALFPARLWREELQKRKQALQTKLMRENNTALPSMVFSWDPAVVKDGKLDDPPKRRRGRPPASWTSSMLRFET